MGTLADGAGLLLGDLPGAVVAGCVLGAGGVVVRAGADVGDGDGTAPGDRWPDLGSPPPHAAIAATIAATIAAATTAWAARSNCPPRSPRWKRFAV